MATIRIEQEIHHAVPVPRRASGQRPLEVFVLYTTFAAVRRAILSAAALAQGLGARIRLLVSQPVPYILPLAAPPVSIEFIQERLGALLGDFPVEIHIDIRVCRDTWEMLRSTLPPRSLVVMGGGRRWWPSRERSLARRLRHQNHQVVCV